MPRKHIVVSGRVQKVGFRNHANHLANECRLTGWVCNLNTGAVAIEVQGAQEWIDQYISKLGEKSFFIRIDHMEINDCDEITEHCFEIRR